MFDRQHAGEPLAHVIAADGRVLFFEQAVLLGELVDGPGQRGAEPGEMGAAVGVGDGVGEAENLVVVAVVVLHDAVHDHVVLNLVLILVLELHLPPPPHHDRLGMEQGFVFAELAHELFDAESVEILLFPVRFLAFVGEVDFQAGIEERKFPEARGEFHELKLGGDGENRGIGLERDERSGVFLVFDLPDDGERLGGYAPLKPHVVDVPVTLDFHLEPVGERVDALRSHAVQTARVFVSSLTELSSGMQVGEHQLNGGDFEFRVDVHGDAAPVVANRAGAVDVDGYVDPRAVPRKMFVDGVVEHFEDAVVKAPLIGWPNIHSRTLPHSRQPLEFVDF